VIRVLAPAVVLAIGFVVGAGYQEHADDRVASAIANQVSADRDHERLAAKDREDRLNTIIEHERTDRANAMRQRDEHLSALTRTTVRVRHELQGQLDAARGDREACVARITGISDAVAVLIDGIGELETSAGEVERENKDLRAANHKLANQVTGWQQRYRDLHVEQIVVTPRPR
jgi:FtsZ-binding cell division protein ZapB